MRGVTTGKVPDIPGSSRPTLGALLYGDTSVPSIPEDDWVDLVRSIGDGDQRALRRLYERTHRLVFTLALRIAGNRESAEEVTVDVFRDIWRSSAAYDRSGGSVVGWIMNQARSRAIDRVRFEQRQKRRPREPDATDSPAASEAPDAALDGRQQRVRLHAALAGLTPDERSTLETAYFSELTYSETATRLDLPLGTVKTRVRSALSKLRKALESEGGSK